VNVENLAEMHADAALIEQLPEHQRQVMTAAALGLSREQMAEALGWTVRAVDRHLARARARLRDLRG
jgi:DNA-directed RNA polymerase specialized sigma24 family protein